MRSGMPSRGKTDRASDLRQPLLDDGPRASSSGGAWRQQPRRDEAEEEDLEQSLPAAPQTASVWRLLREARPEAGTLSVATVFLLIGSLANLAVPKIAGGLIDACTQAASGALTPEAARHVLDRQLLLVVAVMAAGGVASGLRAYLFNAAAERVMCRLRVTLFSRLLAQEVAFYDVTPVGELSNRLSEDTRAMKDAATTSISMALRGLVTAVLGAVMMFLTSWKLALLTCATLPFMLLQFRIYARMNKRYVTSQLAAAATASATAQEVLAGIRTVKSFAKEQQTIARYSGAADDILRWGLKSALAGGFFTAVAVPFAYACMMLVLWYGAVLVLARAMTIGDLNAFMLYAIYVAGSAGGLAGTAAQVIAAVGAGKRVFQLMDRTPQLAPAGDRRPPGAPGGASLEFRAVSFAYPSRNTCMVLRDFDLQVAPGQTVALCGPSGGAKSTVVKLVQRFYDPTHGTVLLNGVPLPLIDNVYLHQSVALVAQEPLVFADTIRANILFGVHRTDVTQAEIEAAAVAAHAHDFITALPRGYASKVGEQGVMLSGGQKQRLAIARALLTQPQLLLLDEATSALDAESERLVQEALQEAARHRSVVVVAHRLSTVSTADLVAVVQQGRIVERGTHAGLMAQGGAYAQLVQRQLFAGGSSTATEAAAGPAPPAATAAGAPAPAAAAAGEAPVPAGAAAPVQPAGAAGGLASEPGAAGGAFTSAAAAGSSAVAVDGSSSSSRPQPAPSAGSGVSAAPGEGKQAAANGAASGSAAADATQGAAAGDGPAAVQVAQPTSGAVQPGAAGSGTAPGAGAEAAGGGGTGKRRGGKGRKRH